MKDYNINDKGIYYTENSYHNEVDFYYVVEFNQEKTDSQLTAFLHHIKLIGAEERTRQIATLLGINK